MLPEVGEHRVGHSHEDGEREDKEYCHVIRLGGRSLCVRGCPLMGPEPGDSDEKADGERHEGVGQKFANEEIRSNLHLRFMSTNEPVKQTGKQAGR